MEILTNGNSKLGSKIYNFNLPRKSCKIKTAECKKYCYAKSGTFMYPNVKKGLKDRYAMSKKDSFAKVVSAQITYLKAKDDISKVRIHSSGDFYSQEYYDKWNKIASEHKDIVFLAYTRNYNIDFSDRQDNFKIYYSVDKSTKKMNKTLKLKAFVEDKEDLEKIKHMRKVKKGRICNSKCKKCGFCFKNKKENIVFPRR